MDADTSILDKIPDQKPVRIFLPIKQSRKRYRTQAVYKQGSSPAFELYFRPGTLPLDNLDQQQPCLINVDFGGPNISMEATISAATHQVLTMTAQKLVSHEQMREFFRVDATTKVMSKSFQPEFFSEKGRPWSLKGTTIDISGSGLLAFFNEQPPADRQVRLEISLPTETPDIVKVLARPVRSQQIDKEQWEVAYHFEDISIEDRDKIIGWCLEIQRHLLRLKADTDDLIKS
jgi:hypothetical protein